MLRPFSLALALLLLATACIHQPTPQPPDLMGRYLDAVKDAEVAAPSEISRSLVPIVPWNDHLIRNEKGAVRVVSWTDWTGYDSEVGQRIALSREVWVTVVPHLKDFCHACGLSGEALALRLRQRLGLPPHDAKTRFVEFWVSPEDLFRPAPDPEITDREAEIAFPESERFVSVSQNHRQWIENLKKTSYGEKGYPWTRLGYTYDWGGESEMGESEFVIANGAEVVVHSVTPTEAYCKKAGDR